MFDALNRLIKGPLAPSTDPAGEADRLHLATCVLLLEAAHADSTFSPEERDAITGMVRRRFSLDNVGADELMTAAEQARRQSGDLYEFARQINEAFPRARKLAIVELLWEVVYSDGVLEAHEDALMHKIGLLLGVRHDELMALKLKVKRAGDPSSS